MSKRGKHDVGIVGVYPPPYGGISVHVERLHHHLTSIGVDCTVYDGSNDGSRIRGEVGKVIPIKNIERWCWGSFFRSNESVIHNHFLRWQVRFALSLSGLKGTRVIHSLHSYRNDEQYTLPMRWMIKLTGWLSSHFIVVNEEIRTQLMKLGIADTKISVIPAFIPPIEEEHPYISAQTEAFFSQYPKVILANGGVGTMYKEEDLYGLDLCVEMMIHLCTKHSDIGLIYCITHIVSEDYLTGMITKVRENGVEDQILFIHEKMPLYPLMKKAALFVRPTSSDGDAVSIREALYYHIPAMASDVVQRPQWTILFENRNVLDFTEQCELALMNPDANQQEPGADQELYLQQIVKLLR